MKIGLQVMRFDWSENASEIRDRLITIAKLADQSGFYSLWVMDHLFQMGGEFGPPRGTHARRVQYDQLPGRHHKPDPFGNAAYREFLSVSRSPDQNGLNADVLSGGRPYLGIGAGWYKREARGRGLPLPEVSERFARLEETLQIAKHMWSGQRTPDLGKHYQLQEPINCPQPLQQPHPPILIGGEGEKKTLRLVAQYGNACNLHAGGGSNEYAEGIESIRSKLAVLRGHCERLGRPYEEIERTALAGISLSQTSQAASDIVELCQALTALGVQHVIFNMPDGYELKGLEFFIKAILPKVKKLT